MKFNFLSIMLFLVVHETAGQQAYSAADSVAVFRLISKASQLYEDGNTDSALLYCGLAQDLAKQKHFIKGEAYALMEAVDLYIDLDQLDRVMEAASRVNKAGLQLKDSLITAVGWLQMGQAKLYANKFEEAISFIEKSLSYYLSSRPTKYSALAYNDLGYCWGRKGELSKQAGSLIQSISIYEKHFPDMNGELGIAYSNLSTVYYGLNDMHKAIEYGKKSLAYREKTGDVMRLSIGCCNLSQFYVNIDSVEAEKYLQLCVKYAVESNQEARMIHAYVTAANLYSNREKYKEAEPYEMKAIDLLEKSKKDPVMLSRRYLAAGVINWKLKKDSALVLDYFNKGLAGLLITGDRGSLREVYRYLAGFYNENKNYEAAYENYKKHILYKDSIISDKTKSSVAEITTRYETEKKDNEIVRLQSAQRIKQLEIEKQKAVIDGNVAMALQKQNEIDLLSKSQQLRDIRIKQQEEQLEKQFLLSETNAQRLQLTEKENQLQERQLKSQRLERNLLIGGLLLFLLFGITFFNRYQLKKKYEQQKILLDVRNNIARDLHDEIGSTLTSIKILSQVSQANLQKDRDKAAGMISKITEQSTTMQQGMSDIIWAIKPDNDKLDDMLVRMREYVTHTLESGNVQTNFSANSDVLSSNIGMQQRRDFFLVFKEAVNNIAKYANASVVDVALSRHRHSLIMEVKDNGVGFDTQHPVTSNGLKNMKARAIALGGHLLIESSPQNGTLVRLTIPAT